MTTPRTHTVIGSFGREEYTGFARLNQTRDSKPGTLVATVWFEGDPEMYSLDNLGAVGALRQYYVNSYGEQDYPVVVSMVLESLFQDQG